jgi:hypothetical protein
LQNWVSQLQAGISPTQIQADILGSDEYYQRNGGTPDGFVRGLYHDILGRDADYDEIYSWVARLYATGSRIQVAADFLDAAQAELSDRTAPPQPLYGTTVVPAAPAATYSYVPYSYLPYHGYHAWGWHRPWYHHDYHQAGHFDSHRDGHHDGHHR